MECFIIFRNSLDEFWGFTMVSVWTWLTQGDWETLGLDPEVKHLAPPSPTLYGSGGFRGSTVATLPVICIHSYGGFDAFVYFTDPIQGNFLGEFWHQKNMADINPGT
jgi:hypothetical protein